MNSKYDLDAYGQSYVLIFKVFSRNQIEEVTFVTRQIGSDIIKPAINFRFKLIIS